MLPFCLISQKSEGEMPPLKWLKTHLVWFLSSFKPITSSDYWLALYAAIILALINKMQLCVTLCNTSTLLNYVVIMYVINFDFSC